MSQKQARSRTGSNLMSSESYTERNHPTGELAAGLTDLALGVLRKAGVRGDSVEMELELWRALTAGLERELRWGRSTRFATETPLDVLLLQVIHRAVLDVAFSFAPERVSEELDVGIRPWLVRLPITRVLRELLGQSFAANEDSTPRP